MTSTNFIYLIPQGAWCSNAQEITLLCSLATPTEVFLFLSNHAKEHKQKHSQRIS